MDDSVALADAISDNPKDMVAALEKFRRTREPTKKKLVEARDKSILWYENVGAIADRLDPVPFVFDFMTRTGRISLERLHRDFPDFMARHGEIGRSYLEDMASA